jgi:DNA-binding MarR family transcriptional regulator
VHPSEWSEADDGRDPTWWEVVRLLRRVNHAVEATINATLREEGLTFAQLQVLILLDDRPNLHAGGIARTLGVRRQSAHELIQRLYREHLIGLLPKTDGVQGVFLTSLGRQRASDALDVLEPIVAGLVRRSASNGRDLVAALRRAEMALRPPAGRWWLDR